MSALSQLALSFPQLIFSSGLSLAKVTEVDVDRPSTLQQDEIVVKVTSHRHICTVLAYDNLSHSTALEQVHRNSLEEIGRPDFPEEADLLLHRNGSAHLLAGKVC